MVHRFYREKNYFAQKNLCHDDVDAKVGEVGVLDLDSGAW